MGQDPEPISSAPTLPATPLDGAVSDGAVLSSASEDGGSATDRQLSLVDHEARWRMKARLVRAMTVGLFGWSAFLLSDFAVYALGRASPWMVVTRAFSGVVLAGLLVFAKRREDPSPRELRFLEVFVFAGGVGCESLLAAFDHDGLASYHVSGTVLVILSYGVMLGSPWRHALLPVGAMTVVLPLALLGLGPLLFDHLRAQLGDTEVLTRFILSYSVVVGGAVLTVFGGDLLWGLRQEAAVARSIGRYRLRRRIAAGGMGEVWAAYHAGLQRDVAVKLIRAQVGRGDPRIERFEREVRATAELTHPNTVRVFDYGVTEDGIWYYAMELLEGEDLDRLVSREGPMSSSRAVRLIRQAAEGLEEAHRRGIVHRDIKPANLVVVGRPGHGEYVKVIDFGIARTVTEAPGLTQAGTAIGTPGFMAPEVIMGGTAGPAADVYALGAVLYVLLTGRQPLEGETPRQVALAHLHAEIAPPSARGELDIPAELERIVMRCLAKEPGDRYADAGELATALTACESSTGRG